MKRGATDHPKIFRLAALLDTDRAHAIGLIESMLHWAAKYAIEGNVGKWDNQTIAAGIGYAGDPDKLIGALVEARWLDTSDDPNIRLGIHDLSDHADNTWRQCLQDSGKKFWDSKPARRASSGRPKAKKTPAKLQDNSSETPAKLQDNSSETPAKLHSLPSPSLPLPSLPEPSETKQQEPPEAAAVPTKPKTPDLMAMVSEHPNLNTEPFLKAWGEWIAYRRETKKSMSGRSAKMLLNRLAPVGPDVAIETINRSIMNSWQGLFPPAPQLAQSAPPTDHRKGAQISEEEKRRYNEQQEAERRAFAERLAGKQRELALEQGTSVA